MERLREMRWSLRRAEVRPLQPPAAQLSESADEGVHRSIDAIIRDDRALLARLFTAILGLDHTFRFGRTQRTLMHVAAGLVM